MTTLIPKFDLKDGGATPTGAINRPINQKLSESVSVKDFGAVGDGTTDDSTAIQNAINYINNNGGGSLYFPFAKYKINSAITHYASVCINLENSTLDFSSCTATNAWKITSGNGTQLKCCLFNGTLIGVATPTFEGPYNTTTNGINFSTGQLSIQNVTVQAFLNGFYFDSNAYAITLNTCLAYFNNLGWNADQTGKTNMGAQLLAIGCGFAHEDYDIVNNLCESTFYGCYFDSIHLSYVKTNITASGGTNNGFLKFQDCRFEAGGNASYPWFNNAGYLIMRDTKFIDPGTYNYLFDNNAGFIVLDRGLSRIAGTSRNTNSGKINLFGIKQADFNAACFQTTVTESNIYNSDFELGTTAGWTVTAGSAGNLTVSTDAHTGTYSLQFLASGGVSATANSYGIPIPTGAKQMLTNMYYKNLNTTNTSYYNLLYYSSTGEQIGGDTVALPPNTTTWTFARWTGYIPTGTAYAKIQMNLASTETAAVRIDDLYASFS